ncbi:MULTISPECIES: hypothetical protein [Steroidobacteraceae]|uniref:hypothetical protein n=1 Tax=Steroidobacteraceae TaxID=2689614 RepID=UPI00101E008C|nr:MULTISPECIES: hypothetical protein [Steroidobacteraceae]
MISSRLFFCFDSWPSAVGGGNTTGTINIDPEDHPAYVGLAMELAESHGFRSLARVGANQVGVDQRMQQLDAL